MEVVDEVPRHTRKVDWPKVIETARAHPNKWTKVPVPLTSGMHRQIKLILGDDVDQFIVTSRLIEDAETSADRQFYIKFTG